MSFFSLISYLFYSYFTEVLERTDENITEIYIDSNANYNVINCMSF